MVLLLCYKARFPENVFLLRGHHEISSVNRFFGFYDECKARVGLQFWKLFNEVFSVMPICAVIEHKIFCVHGGLSPELESLSQISKISRPLEISNNGIAMDMLWSDPEPLVTGWQENERGISFCFGMDVVYYFLKNNSFDLLVRSHQVVENGYEFMFSKQVVSLFSAANYLGEYENYGAIMVVEEDLRCSFEIIKPKFKNRKEIVKPSSSPFKK
jgi:serine/threonine-protein phosphatase PP1 catalytic subunit